MKNRILVATTNPGKVAEISAMLDLDVEWLSLGDFREMPEIEEDGANFAENAQKKAMGYAKATGLWALADDSGLCVDALNGAPGVNSARFSGEKEPADNRTLIDHRNIAKLLDLMRDIPPEKRTARFICSLCLATADKIIIETQGTLEGVIAEKEIGTNGFGYDPVFFVPQLNKTAAQLSADEKNTISHRGNAIRKLKPLLKKVL